jgi:uncharacterized protein YxjI
MQFPIQIVFKLLALAPQMYVNDSAGQHLGYVKQKLLAFKEKVTVYTDETQATPIYSIAADRVIDFNAEYHFSNAQGVVLGSVKRSGMRSLWRAHYVITMAGAPAFELHEESAWVRLIDGVLGEIPFVGFLTGYFLNPKYNITRTQGTPALRMIKQRAIFESTFTIERLTDLTAAEQEAIMLGLMMIVLLERSRG